MHQNQFVILRANQVYSTHRWGPKDEKHGQCYYQYNHHSEGRYGITWVCNDIDIKSSLNQEKRTNKKQQDCCSFSWYGQKKNTTEIRERGLKPGYWRVRGHDTASEGFAQNRPAPPQLLCSSSSPLLCSEALVKESAGEWLGIKGRQGKANQGKAQARPRQGKGQCMCMCMIHDPESILSSSICIF
mgnify:CR=1 FL=1